MTDFDFEQDKLNAFASLTLLRNAIVRISPEDREIAAIDELLARLHSRQYMVAVVGEFNRGKSSLINALLGMRILPADITPTTATVNRVVYSKEPYSCLHMYNGETMDVPTDMLKEYVTKLTESARSAAEKVEEAVIGYPTAFCRNNIAILDTPGLNESEEMDALTYRWAEKCDALIYTISVEYSFSESEARAVCRFLASPNIHHMLFTVGFIDKIPVCERERVIDYTRQRIYKLCADTIDRQFADNAQEAERCKKIIREADVYAVSAKEALESFIKGDAAMEKDSGIEKYKNHLMQMLTANRDEWFAYEIQPYVERMPQTYDEAAQRLTDPLYARIRTTQEHLMALRETLEGFTTQTVLKSIQLKKEMQEYLGTSTQVIQDIYSTILNAVTEKTKSTANTVRAETHNTENTEGLGGYFKSLSERIKQSAYDTGYFRESGDVGVRALNKGYNDAKEDLLETLLPDVQNVFEIQFEKTQTELAGEIAQVTEHFQILLETLNLDGEIQEPITPIMTETDTLTAIYKPSLFDEKIIQSISSMKVGNLRYGSIDGIAKKIAENFVEVFYPAMIERIDASGMELSTLAEHISRAGLALLPRIEEELEREMQRCRKAEENIASVRSLTFPDREGEEVNAFVAEEEAQEEATVPEENTVPEAKANSVYDKENNQKDEEET